MKSVIAKCSRKNRIIMLGDLNAKVGMDNTGYEDIIGRHGLGERNENGKRFANLYAFNKLVIGGKIFPHKRIHKATWVSPDHITENQIDHICTSKKIQNENERHSATSNNRRRPPILLSSSKLLLNLCKALRHCACVTEKLTFLELQNLPLSKTGLLQICEVSSIVSFSLKTKLFTMIHVYFVFILCV
ncbi:unnamed protein product [Schistosoma margrebowiei]|uniref:Endonuclease/exonuclease/phosphatase domain-containing protein n=1 Tax=Schistosoma margrebowiei TaxID=48269 RepID=A0A3P8EYW5_9TREM|nr:unnamed protein product [Schistosoma margrebowiei]